VPDHPVHATPQAPTVKEGPVAENSPGKDRKSPEKRWRVVQKLSSAQAAHALLLATVAQNGYT